MKRQTGYNATIFIILIIVAVVITGSVLYLNLSKVSSRISESAKSSVPASILAKQILVELRSSENNARSFNLTKDSAYVVAFYNSVKILNILVTELKMLVVNNATIQQVIDSIAVLSTKGLAIIKVQSYLEDPVKVANELNLISEKIDETYEIKEDTVNRIKYFFKRLFGKKENLPSKVENHKASVKISDNNSLKDQLKKTLQKVKSTQVKYLLDYKQTEYQMSKALLQITGNISLYADELEQIENLKAKEESAFIKKEVNKIKYYSILFSLVITCFLFMLVYLFRNYIKKKNQYENALLESKQRAEELAKAKETFLANMSHEIKTPLNAMYGFTEQILSGSLKPEQERQLNIVKNSAAYLTKLVNDILTYAKLQAGKSQLEVIGFNLKREISDIEALFKNQADSKGLDLIFNIDNSVPEYIKSDANKIKQMMYNVIGNAIKFTSKGEVKIDLKSIDKQEIKITVSDTGIGIEEDKLPKLFNEFEQADDQIFKKYGGTGLGLMITKQLVEQMNGKINLESKPREGTTVTISLPVEFTEMPQEADNTDIAQNSSIDKLNGLKILIVDDEQFNRLLLKSILKKYNVTVFEAESGNEAIILVKTQPFDLVIMDIRMPGINGLEATYEIRKRDNKLPVLASTAVVSEEKVVKCIQAGMNGIVFKPFTEIALIKNIINALKVKESSFKNENSNIISKNIINVKNIDEYSNGDENFKKEMISIFHKSINNGLEQIKSLAKERNYHNISEIAHKIIPSCKHFDAESLVVILKYFEEVKNKQNIELLVFDKKLEELNNEIDIINKELELLL